jgi:uncharacterized membrane protein
MMKKHVGIIVLLATVLALCPAPGAQANVLQVSVDDIYLTAGEANSVKVTLRNLGELNIYTVEAFLVSQTSGISILKESQKVYDEILSGKAKQYYPVLFVDQGTPLGTYTLSLTVNYIRYGTVYDSTITVPVGVVVSNESRPKLLYVSGQETLNAKTGMSNELEYVFRNDWDREIRSLGLTISSTTSYLILTDGSVSSFESMAPGEEIRVNPTVSALQSAPLGVYTLTTTATYVDDAGNSYYQNYVLPVNVNAKALVENTIITITEMDVAQTVRPGDAFDVTAEVQCEGADAFDLISSISLTGITKMSPLSPTKVSVGDMQEGDTRTVTWELLASGDAPAGQYPVSIGVTYLDDKGSPGSLSEVMTITVEELIDFELLDAPTIEAGKGETGEIEADLLLIGTDSVQFVSVDLVEDAVFKRVTGSTEYIGAVDPDSPIPFDITYRVADDAPQGTHTMSVRVSYRDHLNREHNEDVSLDVTVSGGQTGNGETPEAPSPWVWLRRLLGLGP